MGGRAVERGGPVVGSTCSAPLLSSETMISRNGVKRSNASCRNLRAALLGASREVCLKGKPRTIAYPRPWFTIEVKRALQAVRKARKLHQKANSYRRIMQGHASSRHDTLRLLVTRRGLPKKGGG